ncbi:hypothetical protein JCM19037_4589 [Geomicrobium sp. JCM 19037]|uniref:hypothetical protein n=1 Tax=Geomicrobium sp. JCM 19037 TaxID=1460634 RepID=UPI00045F1450|nr:hypothetical protein [Geomicrobium sp. JCM 19037]GAK06036.1 hypothetical protein JCM19037_4589 [Geomicrobium sp. JCM 19037]
MSKKAKEPLKEQEVKAPEIKAPEIKSPAPVQEQKTRVNKTTGSFIYAGPTLKRIQANSLFRGEPPEFVKEVFDKNSAANALFVPVAKLGELQKKLSVKGSREQQLFKKASELDVKGSEK